ncbi:shikimate dehydrogenase family protein [Phytohabitans kaempferiae]|uniref:shikimate dehydrogenase (NADP(+)) n=1 Tax=Phytohabitans kaempferiae TaxID=1620943 RepID=A0ABV6M9P7_9ACTN
MTITGNTRVYAHIGHPMGHVRTPTLYNRLLAERGLDVVVMPLHIRPEDLATAPPLFRSWANLAGVGVTIPHKETMTRLVDELTPMAARCGATNVIRRDPDGRLVGGQFDGLGMTDSLVAAGHSIAGREVLLVGAGGTARAVAFALADAGVAVLRISNRTAEKASELAAAVLRAYPQCRTDRYTGGGRFDVVINTTSLGMRAGDPVPVDLDLLTAGTVVADAVMSPPTTPLLAAAAERGCAIHPGKEMLAAQFDRTIAFLRLTEVRETGAHGVHS